MESTRSPACLLYIQTATSSVCINKAIDRMRVRKQVNPQSEIPLEKLRFTKAVKVRLYCILWKVEGSVRCSQEPPLIPTLKQVTAVQPLQSYSSDPF
jgi:hypothetical protein